MTIDRRSLVKAAAAPFFVRNLISAPPGGKVRVASFGAGGMAWYTLDGIASHPQVTLVCVADVDSAPFAKVKEKYPNTRVYEDWRKMLRRERRNLDAVCIATPDHMHAPMAMSAMREGLHVYVQKPLTHNLHEARRLAEAARAKGVVSQMGIQVRSSRQYRTAEALVRNGAIGKVKEVHSWSEKKWGDSDLFPDRIDPVPSTLNWNDWLGVASKRPYVDGCYHPLNWRKRLDFGTATFGDMGCHIVDPVFGSLGLSAPISVRSEGPTPGSQSWAINAIIRYTFPGTQLTAEQTIPVSWYDGDERPPREVQELIGSAKLPGQGSIFIGTNGVMLLPHIGMPVLLPEKQFEGFAMPEMEQSNHYHQFVDAVLGKQKVVAGFDYAGPLTESVLLGPLATRFPKTTLEWDAANLRFRNSLEATAFVRSEYRSGWKVKGLG
jgi:predicted dehydrogenase